MNSGNRRTVTNFVYSSLYQIFSIIIPIITTPYLARTIGSSGIGEYGYSYSIALYFSMFVKLGYDNYGGREVAYHRDNKEELSIIFSELYCFQLISGTIISSAYFLYCFMISPKSISYLLGLYVISSVIDVTWFYWGLEEFKTTVTRDFIIKIASTVLIFLFVRKPDDTWKYAFIICSSCCISQLMLWVNIKKKVSIIKPTIEGVKRHIKPNLVLFIPTIAISLYQTMDKIMLGAISGNIQVGYYQSSESIIKVPLALITSLGAVMQPRMANLISKDTNDRSINNIYSISIATVMFISSSVSFGIMSISNEFVPLFYGKGFEECIVLFQILLPSCLFVAFANVLRTQFLIPRKKDKEYIISLFAGAIINLLLNSIFIPSLGATGAAIGTLAAQAAVCLAQVYLTKKEVDNRRYIFQSFPFIISGAVMYFIWRNIRFTGMNNLFSVVLKILCAGFTYIILFLILEGLCERVFEYDISILGLIKKLKVQRGKEK